MTTYVPTPVTQTVGSSAVILLTTEDDLSGQNMTIELMCDGAATLSVQYDIYGDGTLWVTQGSHAIDDTNESVTYVGKGKTRISATKTDVLASVIASCRINTYLNKWGVNYAEVRKLTKLTTTDASNKELEDLIDYAGSQFNNDVCAKRIEEPVWYIDMFRMNQRNGTNTTYYLLKGWDNFIGDLNDDGEIDENDVEVWLYDIPDKTKAQTTVSSVDERGSFTLETAPQSDTWIKVTYRFMPISLTNPLVKKAVTELSCALAYTKTSVSDIKKVQINKLTIERFPDAFKYWMEKYKTTINQITAKDHFRKQTADEARANFNNFRQEPILRTSAGGQFVG